jgi:serine/threonine protein kinase
MLFYDKECSMLQNYRRVQTFVDMKNKNTLGAYYTDNISKRALSLLKKTLEVDPAKRISSEDIINHSIFLNREESLPETFAPYQEEEDNLPKD